MFHLLERVEAKSQSGSVKAEKNNPKVKTDDDVYFSPKANSLASGYYYKEC